MTTPAAPTPNQMPGAQAAPAAVTDPPAPAAPAASPAAGVVPPALAPAPAAAPAAPVPPWEASGEPFDPARAWSLIENVRSENADLKGRLTAAQPALDAVEAQRRAEQGALATAQEDTAAADRRGDTWRDRAITSQAQALATAARFQDPGDAITMIGDLSGFVVGDEIDVAKLTERINQLATDKPYLLATGTPAPPGLTPNRGQGQSGGGPADTLDAQIAAAQARGDFTTAIALKQQKAFQR